jgi:hypothetical protein
VSLSVTLTTWGVSYEQTLFPPKDQFRAESGFYFRDEEFDSYKKRLAELEQRVRELEAKAASTAPARPLSQTPNQLAPRR